MIIGDRLREMREAKQFSQCDIEKRTGLLRCYISRVENGHTVPAIETLEKMARALEIPMYQFFYDSDEPPNVLNLPKGKSSDENTVGQHWQGCTLSEQAAPRVEQDRQGKTPAPVAHGPEYSPSVTSSSA